MQTIAKLGIGIGWRPELALAIERTLNLGFVEITAENHPSGMLPPAVERLRQRGVAVIPHGISVSLGGAEPIQRTRVAHIDALARGAHSPLVSEHIAFVRAGGKEIGHLTPLPRTKAALNVLVENIDVAQRHLSVPLALENVSALFDWPEAEFSEAEFLTQVLERTNCWLLLDLANLYANSVNLGTDPSQFLEAVPLSRIAYVHMGGGIERDGVYHDTHAHPVAPGALDLLSELCARTDPPGVMLERDDDFPDEGELRDEMARIRVAIDAGARRRTPVDA
jgi:uncharacterized protein (UPF0276 family)